MAEPFLSEIRMMSFNFPPKGWALCDGQFLPINQNQAMFALLGTRFGGNGQTNFQLPDLRGRVPVHWGGSFILGERGGEAAHTLTLNELPAHTHAVVVRDIPATDNAPLAGQMLAQSAGSQLYHTATNLTAMDPRTSSTVGGSQPHQNMMPYGVVSFCIALQGLFPTAN